MPSNKSAYIGRFAPSPSGPLHFGSLVCALASYLDAKKNNGQWLLRVEDIDPPRALTGAEHMIIKSLTTHGFEWDGDILYQSTRSDAYNKALNTLTHSLHAYPCDCSRKRLQSLNMVYDGHCRQRLTVNPPTALRLKVSGSCVNTNDIDILFNDLIQGKTEQNLEHCGDFIIHRKDGLFAYQLAVVVDDIYQGITHVIRGHDLIDSTPKQIYLLKLFGSAVPMYGHIPVITGKDGHKLSKQAHASAIDDKQPNANLYKALHALQMSPPHTMKNASVKELLTWGITHWSHAPLQSMQSMSEASL